MPKGKEEVPEQEVSVEETPSQEETPTEQQQMETLQAKLQQMEAEKQAVDAERKRLEEGYKGLQSRYNKTYEDYKKQEDLRGELEDLKKSQRILAAAIAEAGATHEDMEGMPQQRQSELLKKFEALEAEADKRRKEAEQKSQWEEFNQKAQAIYSRAEQAFGEDIDALYQVRQFIRSNDLDLAEKRIAKAEGKNVEPTKETEAEMRKRIEKEVREQIFKEKGGNITDTGSPSGGTSSDVEFLKEFSEGKRNSPEDFKRASKLITT